MDNNKATLFMQRLEHVDAHYDSAVSTKPVVALATARHRRIYIAGPMTGLPELNYPLFNATAVDLRARGYHVENPAEHGIVEHAEWADYLRYDLGRMATCESIFLLPGWEKSNGARLEVYVAKALGLVFIHAEGARYVNEVEATDLEILETAYVRAGEREHELRLLLVERNETIAALRKSAVEGASILRRLIESIEAKGNYSPESTVNFLNQALSSVSPASSKLACTHRFIAFNGPSDRRCSECFAVEISPTGIDSEGGSHD